MAGAALFAFAAVAEDERQLVTVGPLEYGFLTLPSGHTFKYLSTGPMLGKGGKRLALGVHYVSDATDLTQLKADAAELFEYVRPLADSAREQVVVVVGHFGFQLGKGSRETYNIVYTRDASGGWGMLPPDLKAELPRVARPASHAERRHDKGAEQDATMAVQTWLKLADAELNGDAWEAASPLLKAMVSKAKWLTLASAWNSAGSVKSRAQTSMLSTRRISDGPEGNYVVFEYRATLGTGATIPERVVVMLCEDRAWRVVGYFRGPRGPA